MKKYEHIFFDLDHTLWDFNRNSKETLTSLFSYHKLDQLNKFTLDSFLTVYTKINEKLWDHYRQNIITKEYLRNGRFYETLVALEHDDKLLAAKLADDYIQQSPYKGLLFPHVHETLTYLKTHYQLHIITNGFSEVQRIKMTSAQLLCYFSNLFISEEIGFKKPNADIFHHAVEICHTSIDKCLMVGDNIEADLEGAAGVGMDHIFFNPEKLSHQYKLATYEINCLSRLQLIL